MLATVRAKALIESANFAGLDGVYTANLPTELRDDTGQTVALITEVWSDPAVYGNDGFHALDDAVEVQIFYELHPNFDLEAFELQLMKLFTKDHWAIDQSKPHTTDPDTYQVTKVFYFSQIKYL
jgi:hypothetical protein